MAGAWGKEGREQGAEGEGRERWGMGGCTNRWSLVARVVDSAARCQPPAWPQARRPPPQTAQGGARRLLVVDANVCGTQGGPFEVFTMRAARCRHTR